MELIKYITEFNYTCIPNEDGTRIWQNNNDIKGVVIVNKLLEEFPSKSFEIYSNLETSTAIDVGLKNIGQDDIHSASKLKLLDLSNNHISHLDNLMFHN